eukprot:6917207-Prymnesium_polylepis.1
MRRVQGTLRPAGVRAQASHQQASEADVCDTAALTGRSSHSQPSSNAVPPSSGAPPLPASSA